MASRRAIQACGGGFVVERRVERGVISRRVEAIAADERNALLVERQAGERIVHAVDQQVAVQGIVVDQADRRDRLQPLLEFEQRRLAGRDCLRRIVRPAPGGSHVAALGSAHWILRPIERIEITGERCNVVGPEPRRLVERSSATPGMPGTGFDACALQ